MRPIHRGFLHPTLRPLRAGGVRVPVLALALASMVAMPAARAQDRRHVVEPGMPPSCTVLVARWAAPEGVLSPVAEGSPDTVRIQQAIDACGRGRAVELRSHGSANVFVSGPLELRSGVTLLVAAGTALYASRNPRDYDVTPGSCGIVGQLGGQCRPLILAAHAPGSGIMGDGAIDGRGGAQLRARGANSSWWDLAHEAKVKDLKQACPRLVVARASDDFTLYRITLRNSPNHNVVVERTNGFTAWGVKIRAPKTARNTDGIDPSSSTNVTIAHCSIDTGDDNVALKAGAGGPTAHVTIAHNRFYAGHGMSIGSETSGGVSAIAVSDLTLDGTDYGIRIKSDRSRGGLVSGVLYENVCIRGVTNPILLDTRYTAFAGDKIPVYRDIALRDVHAVTPGAFALLGFDQNNRIRVTLDNVTLAGPQSDVRATHAEIRFGPRRGNTALAGPDVAVVDGGSRPAAPLDCSKRFVAFADTSSAPVAAGKVPPADPTLYVAISGTGDYYSIQRAIDVAPATGAVISIAPGIYRERLRVDKPGIFLRSPYLDPRRTVIVSGESAGTTGSTFKSATVTVTGRDFRAENLTFANDFNRTHVQEPKGSQALALHVTGDRAVFRNVRLLGNQDTLYAGSSDCSPPGLEPKACTLTRQLFETCYIEGNVDFIFGNSVALFSRCEIHSTAHDVGYITAQGRQHQAEQSLFVFDRCRLTAEPGVAHVWLGRPWRDHATVVFLDTEMGAHIEPPGWREWHPGKTHYMDTVLYAEHNSTGPGAHPAQRDPHTKKLSGAEAARYDPRKVLRGSDDWRPPVPNQTSFRRKVENPADRRDVSGVAERKPLPSR